MVNMPPHTVQDRHRWSDLRHFSQHVLPHPQAQVVGVDLLVSCLLVSFLLLFSTSCSAIQSILDELHFQGLHTQAHIVYFPRHSIQLLLQPCKSNTQLLWIKSVQLKAGCLPLLNKLLKANKKSKMQNPNAMLIAQYKGQLTCRLFLFDPSVQCAAVRTHLLLSREPPHHTVEPPDVKQVKDEAAIR